MKLGERNPRSNSMQTAASLQTAITMLVGRLEARDNPHDGTKVEILAFFWSENLVAGSDHVEEG